LVVVVDLLEEALKHFSGDEDLQELVLEMYDTSVSYYQDKNIPVSETSLFSVNDGH